MTRTESFIPEVLQTQTPTITARHSVRRPHFAARAGVFRLISDMKKRGISADIIEKTHAFIESGSYARAYLVSELWQLDQEMREDSSPSTYASRVRIHDIILRAIEHEHGKAPTRIEASTFQADMPLTDADKQRILEHLAGQS